MKIKLPTLKCLRCGHKWYPKREEMPLRCAKCKSPYWNKPRGPLAKVILPLILFGMMIFSGCHGLEHALAKAGGTDVTTADPAPVPQVSAQYCLDHSSFCDVVKPGWRQDLGWAK